MKNEDDVELCSMGDMGEFGVSKQIRDKIGERLNNYETTTIRVSQKRRKRNKAEN